MGLNIGQQADFLPYVKYNSKEGRWYDKENKEIKDPVFIADFDNIKTGWAYYPKGGTPQWVEDPSLQVQAERPDLKVMQEVKGEQVEVYAFKRAFKLALFSQAHFGGVVEFAANSQNVCAGINDLYMEWEAHVKDNAGKVPVVSYKGSEKQGKAQNHKPLFAIEKWVDRPDILDNPNTDVVEDETDVAPSQAAQTQSEF